MLRSEAVKPVLLTALLASAAALPAGAQGPWRVGVPLPDLRLPTIDGERTIDLAQLRGKKLVLIEFASW